MTDNQKRSHKVDRDICLRLFDRYKSLADKIAIRYAADRQIFSKTDDIKQSAYEGLWAACLSHRILAAEHYDLIFQLSDITMPYTKELPDNVMRWHKGFIMYAGIKIRGSIVEEARRNDHLTRCDRINAKKEIPASRLLTSLYTVYTEELDIDGKQNYNLQLSDAQSDQPFMTDFLRYNVIMREIKRLPKLQRRILIHMFFEDKSGTEIAKEYNLSESRITQIKKEAIKHLREKLLRSKAL